MCGGFGIFLACRARKPSEAEVALRKSVELEPNYLTSIRTLGILLYCEMHEENEAIMHLRRAHQLAPKDAVTTAILAACIRGSKAEDESSPVLMDASREASSVRSFLNGARTTAFWEDPYRICDLVEKADISNELVRLHRAVALAQIGDFPRASVAFEDSLTGDPIELLAMGRRALQVFLASGVRNGRVRDCLELLDRKEWKKMPGGRSMKRFGQFENGSGEYLKRVAVEIRGPALEILRRIAPSLPGLHAPAKGRITQ